MHSDILNYTKLAFNSLTMIQNDTVYQPTKQGMIGRPASQHQRGDCISYKSTSTCVYTATNRSSGACRRCAPKSQPDSTELISCRALPLCEINRTRKKRWHYDPRRSVDGNATVAGRYNITAIRSMCRDTPPRGEEANAGCLFL